MINKFENLKESKKNFKMESFKSLYLEYCKTYNAEPQEAVKSELKRLALVTDETSYTFNLSSHHLTDKTCMILSKLLSRDQKFTTLQLNDCSLSNDGKFKNFICWNLKKIF